MFSLINSEPRKLRLPGVGRETDCDSNKNSPIQRRFKPPSPLSHLVHSRPSSRTLTEEEPLKSHDPLTQALGRGDKQQEHKIISLRELRPGSACASPQESGTTSSSRPTSTYYPLARYLGCTDSHTNLESFKFPLRKTEGSYSTHSRSTVSCRQGLG